MMMTVTSGPWTMEQIRQFMDQAVIPIRLASAGSPGPIVQSLWFIAQEDSLWCCTQHDALVVRRLTAEPTCGFEIAADRPPYRGVRGTGRAVIVPERAASVLPALLDRYGINSDSSLARWLLSRLDHEVAIQISGLTLTSWDYAERMAGTEER